MYRRGEHACPADQPYAKHPLVFGSLRNERSCGRCEAKHEKGEIRCGYQTALSVRETSRNCAAPESLGPQALC